MAAHQVSRNLVYQQHSKVHQSLEELFALSRGDDVLFDLPVIKSGHISYSLRCGIVGVFRDLFDTLISTGNVTIGRRKP